MPHDGTEQRKLAAIMFTDMVGYSALAQRNEKLALELLAESQRLLRTQFPLFNGREVKTTGDGFLVEFPSALQATQCAMEIQRAVVARNSTQPVTRQINIRIGIHVGDVVHREADMYGDGVNIAARIEPLAKGGGICLSETVYDQVRNKLDVGLAKLASPELKNIEVPVDVYRVVLPWERQPDDSRRRESAQFERGGWNAERGTEDQRRLTSAATKWLSVAALVLVAAGLVWWRLQQSGTATKQIASAPSVAPSPKTSGRITSLAVKPLDDISGDTNQAYFSDGMTEALCAALGNLSALRVPGRSSVMRYKASTKSIPEMAGELHVDAILEGSVQHTANRMVVTVQLVEAATDRHVWATNYNRDLSDFFQVQSELAIAIATEIKIQVSPEERARLAKTRQIPAAAHEAYLKGRFLWNKRSAANLTNAIAYFQEAIRLDPNYAAAYVGLGDSYGAMAVFGGARARDAYSRGKIEIEKALALDEGLAEAHASLALLKMSFDYDQASAEKEFKRAIELNPNYAAAHYWYALYLAARRRDQEALREAARAVEVDPLSAVAHVHLSWVERFCRRYDRSIAAGEQALVLDPNYPEQLKYFLAWSYDANGMPEKAFALWQELFSKYSKAEETAVCEKAFRTSGIKGYWESRLTLEAKGWSGEPKARIYARVGKKKEALAALEQAFEDKDPGLYSLLCDSVYDDLRSDPQAIELRRKMGFQK